MTISTAVDQKTSGIALTSMSFIVSTLGDRPEELARCLRSIDRACAEAPEGSSLDLVLVNQGIPTNPPPLAHVRLKEVVSLDKGLSRGRNVAISHAEGKYLAFIDDDASVSESFIKVFFAALQENPAAKAICGSILESKSGKPLVPIFKRAGGKVGYFSYQLFMGSAHIVHRRLFSMHGGYDEEFGAGSTYHAAEETELLFRFLDLRETIRYCPELVVYHGDDLRHDIEKKYRYWYGFGGACAKRMRANRNKIPIYLLLLGRPVMSAAVRLMLNLTRKGQLDRLYLKVIKGVWEGARSYAARPDIP